MRTNGALGAELEVVNPQHVQSQVALRAEQITGPALHIQDQSYEWLLQLPSSVKYVDCWVKYSMLAVSELLIIRK